MAVTDFLPNECQSGVQNKWVSYPQNYNMDLGLGGRVISGISYATSAATSWGGRVTFRFYNRDNLHPTTNDVILITVDDGWLDMWVNDEWVDTGYDPWNDSKFEVMFSDYGINSGMYLYITENSDGNIRRFPFDLSLFKQYNVECDYNGCRYNLSRLDDVVYLLPQDAVKDIVIDNGDAYISGITATPLTLKAYNVQVTETEELNERYAFTHTLQFSVDGYMNKGDLDGRYCAMVKSKDGGVWMMNPEFPSKVTYTYTLDSNGSRTDFTLSTISNMPMLRVADFVGADAPYSCSYDLLSIKNLRLNENNYSHVNDNHIIFTNDGFKYVDFMKDSCKFTETFDGKNVSHKLTFNIPFSTYKSSWHYNLLEFAENKYATIIDMSNGKHLLCGFGFGLQPSYTVTVNDGDSVDHIEITLQDVHDNGNLIELKDSLIFDGDGNTTWHYISGYSGYISYECVGLYQAKYLLQEEIDILRNPTGRYKCLQGYQYRFQDLNIIGTFSETVLFECMECTDFCDISTTLPSTLYFYSASTQTFTLNSQSDWSISSMTSFISVTPISGSGGTYTLTVTNTAAPTDIAQLGQLVITYCGGTKQKTVNVTVTKPQGCFPQGKVYFVNCAAQTLEIPTTCCVAMVEDLSGVTTDVKWQPERWIRLTFPLNNEDMDVEHNYSGSSRSCLIKVTYCDGNFDWITVTQDKMYSEWVDECWNCNGSQMCRRWQLYSGTSADETTVPCGQYKYTDCTYSTVCGGACEMWSGYTMVQHPYYCMGGDVYKVERKLVAKNGSCNSGVIVPLWEETLETRLGSKLPAPWTCPSAITYDYRWELTTYGICVGTTKYQSYRLERSSDSGSTWEDVVPSQLSADGDGSETPVIIEEECVECGYVPSCSETPTSEYLTFVAEGNGQFIFTNNAASGDIQYSLNDGAWTTDTAVTVNAGDVVRWKGDLIPVDYNDGIGCFSGSTAQFVASGNVMSLLFGDEFVGQTSLNGYNNAFGNLFRDCTSLTSIDGIVLPATTLADNCYYAMFASCTSLTSVPSDLLPATTLADYCYNEMFMGCTSLTSVPSDLLLATTLADYCYYSMFSGCTSLTSVPSDLLPATTLAERCYMNMFYGCSGLTSVPSDLLPATTLADYCYYSMFNRCTSLTSVPSLPATTLAERCYGRMFFGCTSLTTIQSDLLLATALVEFCYESMFRNCTSLTNAPSLPATTLANNCYYYMFQNCTSLTTAPELLAQTLVERCYQYMFYGCTNLNYIKCLATDISASNCTYNWVNGVASAGTFVTPSSTDWPITSSASSIPNGWTRVDA